MEWLDRESGGTLFRGVTANSASAVNDGLEGDIASKPAVVTALASVKKSERKDRNTAENTRKIIGLGPAQAAVAETGTIALHDGQSVSQTSPENLSQPGLANIGWEEWQAVSRGEFAGIAGSKLLRTGQIEGFQGLFRRVSEGLEPGIWGDEFERVGSKYLLPTLASWFRVTGIEIYETDQTAPAIPGERVFVDWMSQTVMSVPDVRSRMVASLGRDPGGWDEHSTVLSAKGCLPAPGPYEYRDRNEPHEPPHGLIDLVGPNSPLGAIQGVPRWFKEVPSMPTKQLSKGEELNWIYMLRNLQVFFDLNHIRIYEADVIVSGSLKNIRVFIDALTEKVLPTDVVRQAMLDQLGCDPGGWAEHSFSKAASSFDVEQFIMTTAERHAHDLDNQNEMFIDDAEYEVVRGWH